MPREGGTRSNADVGVEDGEHVGWREVDWGTIRWMDPGTHLPGASRACFPFLKTHQLLSETQTEAENSKQVCAGWVPARCFLMSPSCLSSPPQPPAPRLPSCCCFLTLVEPLLGTPHFSTLCCGEERAKSGPTPPQPEICNCQGRLEAGDCALSRGAPTPGC